MRTVARASVVSWKLTGKLYFWRFLENRVPEAWSIAGDDSIVEWSLGSRYIETAADAFREPLKYFDSAFGEDPVLWSWGKIAPRGKIRR